MLRSLRAQTKSRAKPNTVPMEIAQDTSLQVSYSTHGGKRLPCIRCGKTRYAPPKHTYLRYVDMSKGAKVWRCTWKPLNSKYTITYIIAAKSRSQARASAKASITKTLRHWSGLARATISRLMYKASQYSGGGDGSSGRVSTQADQHSSVTRTGGGNVYHMTLTDSLLYASSALQSGASSIDMAIQAASNKIASTINQRCKGLVGFTPLDRPFAKVG